MLGALAAALVLSGPLTSFAQLVQGGSIQTNDYTVDLTETPVLASSRVIGLGGAYVAIAEGVEGMSQNPAAAAARTPWSYAHFDHDLGAGLTFPSTISQSDFFNTGKQRRTNLPPTKEGEFVFLDLAGAIQLGRWAAAVSVGLQQYGLQRASGTGGVQPDSFRAQILLLHGMGAANFFDGQLIIGAGVRSTVLQIVNTNAPPGEQRSLFSTAGLAPEAGVLVRPNEEPFRVGAAFHSAITSTAAEVKNPPDPPLYQSTDPLYLPSQVTLPWDLNVGVAVQFGPRPLNPRWIDPHYQLGAVRREVSENQQRRLSERLLRKQQALQSRNPGAAQAAADAELDFEQALDDARLEAAERNLDRRLRERYARMSRRYVLVSTSLSITGLSKNAVGVESFLNREVDRSGLSVNYSPHIGVETEAIPNWLKVRAGSYIEPSRTVYNETRFRVHGTLGLDSKVFGWTVFGLFHESTEWRAGAVVDLGFSGKQRQSLSYFAWAVSVGVWR
jgi:hypothetical protein